MARHRRSSHRRNIHDIPDLMRLWLLRLLVPLNGQQEFIREHGFANDVLAEAIGLGEWMDGSPSGFEPKQVRAALRKLYEDAERQLAHSRAPADLTQNLRRLSGLVGLSPIDCRIVEFAVLIHSERLLDDTADWLGSLSSIKVYYALSILLDEPEADIRAAHCPPMASWPAPAWSRWITIKWVSSAPSWNCCRAISPIGCCRRNSIPSPCYATP